MSVCTGCEILPPPLPKRGVLYLVPPMNNTVERMLQCLGKDGHTAAQPHDGIIQVSLERDSLKALFNADHCRLSDQEIQDTKAMFVREGVQPAVSDLARMGSLTEILALVEGRWLITMLNEKRVTTAFQPIVYTDNPERVFAHECLTRGFDTDGNIVNPGRMFAAARAANILFYLDREARITSIRNYSVNNMPGKIFINFNPTAVYRPEHCLITTLDAIGKAGLKPQDIVFEVVESDEVVDVDHLSRILDYYRVQGFGVALDDLGAGYSSLSMLGKLKPDYVKLDIELIHNVDTDPYKERIAENLFRLASELGVETIAEGVETEAEYHWLRDNGATYIQGYYFGRPQLAENRWSQ